MARTVTGLPAGIRLADFISVGALTQVFPLAKVNKILEETGRQSRRQRRLPAHVMVYYVMGLALYMEGSYGEVLRCLSEGLAWIGLPVQRIRTASRSGISQARSRLGSLPMKRLHDEVVGPIAMVQTPRAWYEKWRLVRLDSTKLHVANTEANRQAFGRLGTSRVRTGAPQVRLVSLVETGTQVLFGTQVGPLLEGGSNLAQDVLSSLREDMLCLADCEFFSETLWEVAAGSGAELLWKIRENLPMPCFERLRDGSYLSEVDASPRDRLHGSTRKVRVIEYILEGVESRQSSYRLLTTILDPQLASAELLAALYHERWQAPPAFDEFKAHRRGRRIALRSKTPELVRQEFYGFMLAHFAIRSLMHQAALGSGVDPDQLSPTHTVRVIRRKLPLYSASTEGQESDLSGDPG